MGESKSSLVSSRVDEHGRALKGSQLQVQIYVNRRSEQLESEIRGELPTLDVAAAKITWVSPLEKRLFAEYQDRAFLEALGLGHLHSKLRDFWPSRGPVWDGLARLTLDGGEVGVLLLEGKSYPKELYGGGCAAKAEKSRQMIRSALEQTQGWLGLSPLGVEAWLGPLYQSANRLAYLYFLREIVGVPAWLVHTCFTDDVAHVPVEKDDWRQGLEDVDRKLGLTEASPYAGAVFLRALERVELL